MEGRADHTGLRLAVGGSISGLLIGGWLWGVLALSAHATAAQAPPPSGGGDPPRYVVASCAAAHGPEGAVGSAVEGDGAGCLRELRSHTSTSRQPGAGLEGRVRSGGD